MKKIILIRSQIDLRNEKFNFFKHSLEKSRGFFYLSTQMNKLTGKHFSVNTSSEDIKTSLNLEQIFNHFTSLNKKKAKVLHASYYQDFNGTFHVVEDDGSEASEASEACDASEASEACDACEESDDFVFSSDDEHYELNKFDIEELKHLMI